MKITIRIDGKFYATATLRNCNLAANSILLPQGGGEMTLEEWTSENEEQMEEERILALRDIK